MMRWLEHKRDRLRMRWNLLRRETRLAFNWQVHGKRYRYRRTGGAGVVVSLTSYPPRYATLHLTLQSLLSQSLAADRIVLWIAHADMALLPSAVTELQAAGLEIIACDDLLSYKKMVPLLQQGNGTSIVTADDDIYYWPDWLRQLMDARTPGKLEVICHRMHRMRLGASGEPVPYNDWEFETTNNESSKLNFPTGIGGVLYPPGVFGPKVLDTEAFMALCPRGDDIWFWWMAGANGATFKRVPQLNEIYCWEGTQDVALWKNNLVGKYNDEQIAAMIQKYGFTIESMSV